MKNEKGVSTLLVLVAMLLFASAYVYCRVQGDDDSGCEEFVETVAEKEVENLLDLPDGMLDGKLDITVHSKEQ